MIERDAPATIRRDVADALCVTGTYDETIDRVGRLAVPRFAMLCIIDLVEHGVLTRRALIADPELGQTHGTLRAPHPDVGEGAPAALRSGKPLVYGRGWFAALERADPALAAFSAGPLRSIVALPLTFDGKPLGVLTLGQTFDTGSADIDLASDFGRMASMAIANARLHEEARTASLLAESARVRLSFVSRASSIFARSFERAAVLRRFVTTTTIDFAAAAQVSIVIPDGRDEHYSAGGENSAAMQHLAQRVMRDGRARLDGDDRLLSAPLLSGGIVSGALTFARKPAAPAFVIDDLTLAEDLAARTAMYVEASQAYAHQRMVADTLQQAFRPRELPAVPGLEISAAYRPGTIDMDVGGDWYDVVVMDERCVAFAIGDVMGHGIEAAAVMAEIRSGLRAHLYAQSDPGRCLGYVDTLLANTKDRETFATGTVAFYDRVERTLTLANAGHPLPYLRRINGTVEPLGQSTTLLGLNTGPRTESRHQLERGDILIFYTDGVVEDRALPFDTGIALLEETLATSSEPAKIIDALLAISVASTDDRTLLAFRIE